MINSTRKVVIDEIFGPSVSNSDQKCEPSLNVTRPLSTDFKTPAGQARYIVSMAVQPPLYPGAETRSIPRPSISHVDPLSTSEPQLPGGAAQRIYRAERDPLEIPVNLHVDF